MPLSLTKRIPTGSPLTAAQNDANMTAIENAVNTNTTDIAGVNAGTSNVYSKAAVDALIAGIPAPSNFNSRPVRAVAGGAQTLTPNGTPVKMTFAEDIDPGSNWDNGTSEYTAGATGYYMVSVDTQFDGGGGAVTASAMEVGVGLAVNGSPVSGGDLDSTPSPSGTRWSPGFCQMIQLASGDKLTVMMQAADGVGTGALTVTLAIISVFRLST